MLLSHILSFALLSQAAPEKDPARLGQKHGCTQDGRYWVHQDKGKKVYCWEGAGFNEDGAPPFVKSYFDSSATDGQQPQQSSGDISLNPIGSAPKTAPGGGGGNGSGGGGSAAPKTQTFSNGGPQGGGSFDLKGVNSGGAKVKDAFRDISRDPSPTANSAGGRRELDPVNPQAFGSIENGLDRATVLSRLGEPHGKILNTGDDGTLEIWTYLVRGGGSASVRIDQGKVVKVVKPR